MVKIQSPMSVGTWILTAFAPAAGLGALGWRPARRAAAVAGPFISTYTAVLIATTAIPVWHDARLVLPFVFAGSSMASAGAAVGVPRYALLGASVELAATTVMARRLGELVGRPYHEGTSGTLARLAKGATVAGAALTLAGRGRLGAPALLAGSLALRFSIIHAGRASARDPEATLGPQRERVSRSGGQVAVS